MIYTVTSILPPIHGGRTKSLLERSKFLDQALNIPTTILTTNYNANYNDVYSKFLEEGKVTDNIRYDNIYDWLADYKLLTCSEHNDGTPPTFIETPVNIEGLSHEVIKSKHIVRYYSSDNTYVLYRKFKADTNILEFEDFMSPISKKRIQRWQYNNYGVLHKKLHYSPNSKKRIYEEFFDKEGNIYCTKMFEDNEKNRLIYIQTYKQGRPHLTFKTYKQLFQHYFENKLNDNDVVFCDARLLDKPLLNQQNKTKNILVVHSSHLDDNKTINQSYKMALENPHKVTQYLLLTEKQKSDILNVTNIDPDKISIIPHFIKPHQSTDNVEQLDRFVFIGRIAEEKQINHILYAYHNFLKYRFTTKLSIYGRDEFGQQQKVEQLIEELELQDNVEINEFTNNPLLEFQKSKASLLTSSFEGFGLSVMESINVGCPVISYDVRYGPSEIIDHGKNGYLVEQDNISELTKYMKLIIEQPLQNVHTKPELTFESAKQNYKQLFDSIEYSY